MNKYIIGVLIVIVVFVAGVFAGRYYFRKVDIKVIEKKVEVTKWKTKIEKIYTEENFQELWSCYTSPIQFKHDTEKNYLYVTAFDTCKENTARYEIGTKGNWKVYLGIGLGAGILGTATGLYLYHRYR